jgi:hypothetical protein
VRRSSWTPAATTLRGFSRAHQRDESLRLLQLQTDLLTGTLPTLATQLQGLMAQMAQDTRSLHEGLLAGQARFHDEAQRAYTGLAASVDRSLQGSLAEGARLAGATIEPAVQATLAGLACQTSALHDTLSGAVQRQLEGVRSSLEGSTDTLLRGMAAHHETSARQTAEAWRLALAQQQQGQATLTEHLQRALLTTAAGFEQHAGALLHSVAQANAAVDTAAAAREQERLAVFHQGLASLTTTVREQALQESSAMAAHQQQICSTLEQTAQAITAQAEATRGPRSARSRNWCRRPRPPRAPRPKSSANCATRSATAWCATTPCWTSVSTCWARWAACWTR